MARAFLYVVAASALVVSLAVVAPQARADQHAGATPAEMVTAYQSLADAILAVKKTEEHLVRSIVGAAYAHAQVEMARGRAAIKANDMKGAQTALENVAADVGQIGSEGDNAVGAVRKRLLEGGHHHNAEGEQKGVYDPGFVVVTRTAKQAFLDASRNIGQMARAPKADALEAEWAKVEAAWKSVQPAAN
jgi:hypothetical protein